MTAAAIATMATVEAATITAVSCPLACSRKRKRRAVRTRVRARLAKPSQDHESAWSTTLHDLDPEAGRAALDQQAADLNPPWPLDELQRALTAAGVPPFRRRHPRAPPARLRCQRGFPIQLVQRLPPTSRTGPMPPMAAIPVPVCSGGSAMGPPRASGQTSVKKQPESVSSLLSTRSSNGAGPAKNGFVRC
jgi:hypothetical protein